jgi:hypothetical protein
LLLDIWARLEESYSIEVYRFGCSSLEKKSGEALGMHAWLHAWAETQDRSKQVKMVEVMLVQR